MTKKPHIRLTTTQVQAVKVEYITPEKIMNLYAAGKIVSGNNLFDQYINKIIMERVNCSTTEAIKIAQENVGYTAANYDYQIAEQVEKLLECYHPVFGKVADRKKLNADECLKCGMWLAKLNNAGYKLEDTLLYYPNRTYTTIPMLLADPSLDHLLKELPFVTEEELKDGIEKIEAFNKNLNEDIQKATSTQRKSGSAIPHPLDFPASSSDFPSDRSDFDRIAGLYTEAGR